jgi:hypothetical protein
VPATFTGVVEDKVTSSLVARITGSGCFTHLTPRILAQKHRKPPKAPASLQKQKCHTLEKKCPSTSTVSISIVACSQNFGLGFLVNVVVVSVCSIQHSAPLLRANLQSSAGNVSGSTGTKGHARPLAEKRYPLNKYRAEQVKVLNGVGEAVAMWTSQQHNSGSGDQAEDGS